MNKKLVLPKGLEQHREVLEKTERAVLTASFESEKPNLTDSKLGGTPYYPSGTHYPLDTNDNPMLLLAQINLSDLPQNDTLPKSGMLQFFIPKDDEVFGWGEGCEADDIKILFHEKIHPDMSQIPPIQWEDNYEEDESYFPVLKETKLCFSKTTEYLNTQVYYYNEIIEDDLPDEDIDEPESHYETKVLGYPGFCQSDPREEGEDREILLLQLVSDNVHVCISDYGIMQFFISTSDLEKLDFSNVLYNWDCY